MCLPHADARRLAKIIVGAVRLAHQDPPDSTGVRGACGRGTSIWGIPRALASMNTVSELLLLGTTATTGVPGLVLTFQVKNQGCPRERPTHQNKARFVSMLLRK